jgi:hypothetical protein
MGIIANDYFLVHNTSVLVVDIVLDSRQMQIIPENSTQMHFSLLLLSVTISFSYYLLLPVSGSFDK